MIFHSRAVLILFQPRDRYAITPLLHPTLPSAEFIRSRVTDSIDTPHAAPQPIDLFICVQPKEFQPQTDCTSLSLMPTSTPPTSVCVSICSMIACSHAVRIKYHSPGFKIPTAVYKHTTHANVSLCTRRLVGLEFPSSFSESMNAYVCLGLNKKNNNFPLQRDRW